MLARKVKALSAVMIVLVMTLLLCLAFTVNYPNANDANAQESHTDHTGWIDLNSYGKTELGTGKYYLSAESDKSLRIADGADVTLCLNGYTLTGDIYVENAQFTLDDCSADKTGMLSVSDYVYGVDISGGTFIMNGGSIEDARGMSNGNQAGAVRVDGGTFIMNGGFIRNNYALENNAGVYIMSGEFIMNGGEITENMSVIREIGGVYVENGNATINGGKIFDNNRSGQETANIQVANGLLTINGGQIGYHIKANAIINGGQFSTANVDAGMVGTTGVDATDGIKVPVGYSIEHKPDVDEKFPYFVEKIIVPTTEHEGESGWYALSTWIEKVGTTLGDGKYYLDKDIEEDLTIQGTATLCLNGYTLTASGSNAITVSIELTLQDCNPDSLGKIMGNLNAEGFCWINSGKLSGRISGSAFIKGGQFATGNVTAGTVGSTKPDGDDGCKVFPGQQVVHRPEVDNEFPYFVLPIEIPTTEHEGEPGWYALSVWLEQTKSSVLLDGKYFLDKNITANLEIYGTVTLCLNGYTLTAKGDNDYTPAIMVDEDSQFTLEDCSAESAGKITGTKNKGNNPGAIMVYTGAEFIMNGGTITQNTGGYGGGVANQGSFVMNGGIITNNTGKNYTDEGGASYGGYGGGVYNWGSFIMNGGTISGNDVDNDGGGVYNQGTFEMNGGSISDNTAKRGGGVYNDYFKFSVMNSGVISDNTASENGASIYGSFVMNGGTISRSETTISGIASDEYELKFVTINGGYINDTIANVKLNATGGYFAIGNVRENSVGGLVLTNYTVKELAEDHPAYQQGYHYIVVPEAVINVYSAESVAYDSNAIANKEDFTVYVTLGGVQSPDYKFTYQYAVFGTEKFTNGLPTNAGKYTVKVIFKLNEAYAEKTFDIEITKLQVTLNDVTAVDRQYDGTSVVEVSGELSGVIYGDDVKISGTGTITDANAGEGKPITPNVTLTGKDAQNYELTAQPEGLTVNITKRELKVQWSDTSFGYDGKLHSPVATVEKGLAGEEFELIVDGSAISVGTHTATARMKVNSKNYTLSNATTEFTIVPSSISSDNDTVKVFSDKGFADGVKLNVTEKEVSTVSGLPRGYKTVAVYDITLQNGSATVQPDGTIRIVIMLTAEQQKAGNLSLYYIAEDGTAQQVEARVYGDRIVFETDHLSTYAIASAPSNNSNIGLIIGIVAGVVVVLAVGAVVTVVLVRKKKA